jgi:DNA-binding response OmpR family regulator
MNAETAPKRILLVEDDAVFSELLRTGFERAGWHAEVAPSGTDAFERAATMKPDFILLDIVLPDMTGFEVLRRFKADKRTWQIPVMMLSNLDAEEDIRHARELGAMDYLQKTKYNFTSVSARISKFFQTGK